MKSIYSLKSNYIMFKKLIIVALFVVTCTSCNLDDDGTDASLETLPIKEAEVPTEFIFGRTYTLNVTYDLPDGCHSFYDMYYEYKGDARIVAVNALVSGNQCTEALIQETKNFVVQVEQREDYIFKFWKGKDNNGNDIFEEIIVPVN